MKKINDWFYKTFLEKIYLKSTKEAYERGVKHGIADAEYWHNKYLETVGHMNEDWFLDSKKILTIPKGTNLIFLGGQQISKVEINNLKSEVRAFKNMQIYEIIQNTIRQEAIKKSILNSTDLYSLKGNEQVLAGKMMIFNLDIIKSIIEKIDIYKN